MPIEWVTALLSFFLLCAARNISRLWERSIMHARSGLKAFLCINRSHWMQLLSPGP